MFSLQHARHRMHAVMAVAICLLLLSVLPPHTTQAATKQQEINNALADFKDGQFQRASLANALRSNPNDLVADQLGGVQLGPVGLIKGWKPGLFTMPQKLYSMGAAAIGSRIFVVGGYNSVSGVTSRLANVWSVAVSQLDGSLLGSGWDAEPSLPAVQNSSQTNPNLTQLAAPIASPAVTSVTDASGQNGTIYVIGGNVGSGTNGNGPTEFSSYAVRIGTVVNGRVSGWVEQPLARLPNGVQQASAVTAKIGNVTYLYLIGGLQRQVALNGTTTSTGLKTVYYARIGAQGKLFKPSSPGTEGWDLDAQQIPVSSPASIAGLFDASAVADNFVASTQAVANAIYLMGGQITPAQGQVAASYNQSVFRALINSNGSLNWNAGWTGVMFSPRSQATAISFRGNIYMMGGVPNAGTNAADAQDIILTSYVEDDLSLHQFTNLPPGLQGSGTNFLQSDPSKSILTKPRKLHTSVLVQADANSPNSAFMYVLGGIGALDSDTTDDNGSNTVLYGKIGGAEDVSTTGYASDGWYYGVPVNVAQQFNNVTVQEIDWTTVMTTTNMDIALDYRLSNSNDCNNAAWTEWLTLDGAPADAGHASITGQNRTTIANPTARCFQYRAHLSTQDAFSTPLFLNVSVKVFIPGSPDLSTKSVTAQTGAGNVFLGLSVIIQNVNTIDPPTLAADIDKRGSFFVDMCIFGPGKTVTPPTLPLTDANTQCSTVYANVNRGFLPANGTYTIPQWRDTKTDQATSLINYFKTPGTYHVIVAVDSFNNVDEGIKGCENNNVSQSYTFTVTKTGVQVSLPFVRK
jgi:hypothetical protein